MITDLVLGLLIVCDFALLMFAIALCFVKAPQFLENEYLFREMCGLILIALNYAISQLCINGNVSGTQAMLYDAGLGNFFFWFMGGISLAYLLTNIILYVLERIFTVTNKMETNVNKLVKKDMAVTSFEEDIDAGNES